MQANTFSGDSLLTLIPSDSSSSQGGSLLFASLRSQPIVELAFHTASPNTAQWKPGLGGLVCVAHVRKMPNPSAVIIIDIPAIFLALLVLSCSVSYTHRGSNCVLHPFCVFEAHRNYLLMKHIGPRCVLLTTDDPHRMTHNWTNHRAATTLATANRSPFPGPIAIPRLHSF